MNKFIEKLFGIDKIKLQIEGSIKQAEAAKKVAEDAIEASERAKQLETESKLSPKDRATRKKEAWVGVLNTHINSENIRNGFFELDWNEYFITKLKQEGYGVEGDPDEEIVDRWFRELCANVVVDGDYGGPIASGSLMSKLKEE